MLGHILFITGVSPPPFGGRKAEPFLANLRALIDTVDRSDHWLKLVFRSNFFRRDMVLI
jgi:hypothetical protein